MHVTWNYLKHEGEQFSDSNENNESSNLLPLQPLYITTSDHGHENSNDDLLDE